MIIKTLFLSILFTSTCYKLAGQGRIELRQFACKACNGIKQQLLADINRSTDIDSAEQIILQRCLKGKQDLRYTLFCSTCTGMKMLRFWPREQFIDLNDDSKGFISKNTSDHIYTIKQLIDLFKHRLVLMDSISLDISAMSVSDRLALSSLQLQSKDSLQTIIPQIRKYTFPLTINDFKSAFSNRNNEFSIYFCIGNSTEKLSDEVEFYFISPKEKKELITTINILKKCNPDMSNNDILEFVGGMVSSKYGSVNMVSLSAWYYQLKL